MDNIGVFITALQVIDRHRKALRLWEFYRHGGKPVPGERGDAAFARQVIAEECDFSNLRWFVHKSVHHIVRRVSFLLNRAKPYREGVEVLFESVVNAAVAEGARQPRVRPS